MFADPITITVNGSAKTLARIKSTGTSSDYVSSDGNYTMTISHQVSRGRIRTLIKTGQRVVATDPLSSENDYAWLYDQRVIDRPEVGFDATTIGYLVAADNAWIVAAGVVGKLYGQES